MKHGMNVEDRIKYYMTEARKRLDSLNLPKKQMTFTGDIEEDRRRLNLFTNDYVPYLYQTITAGRLAMAAYLNGDLDEFAKLYERMIGQMMSARLTDARSHQQRKHAKKGRSEDKKIARGLYKARHPKSAKELLQLLNDLGRDPKLKNVQTWFTEFRTP